MLWCNIPRCGSPLLGRFEDEKDEDEDAEEDSHKAEFPFTGVKLSRSGGHRMGAQGAHGAVFLLTTQAEQTHPTWISVPAQARLL